MKISAEIRDLLDEKYLQYNVKGFIKDDPIQIPHLFSTKEDMEISGFLSATIAWGNRRSIINNATRLMELMDNAPYEFIIHYTPKDLKRFEKFVHRTFNGIDCTFFIRSLRNVYAKHGSMELAFSKGIKQGDKDVKNAIAHFREQFLRSSHQKRSEKHISDPNNNSSAKRLCMYLRWMVRKDSRGVDLGIWKTIKPAQLCLPLDVHTGNVSRKLGLLQRKQNDWKAVDEISDVLRQLDPKDPVRYDFSLFGLGVSKEI